MTNSEQPFIPTIHPWNQQVWQDLTSESERSNHALLLCGDKGLGKQDLAIGLAHFVLTEIHGRSNTLFDAGSHPDLHVVMPESRLNDDLTSTYAQRYIEAHSGKKPKQVISIEQIRRLSQALTTHPHISTTRVVIIAFAETLNRNAANALLKSLEEPPANTLFILVSDELDQLTKTIRSRCSLVHLRTPEFAVGQVWLEQQQIIPNAEIATYLAMANNNPLQAITLFENQYIEQLKAIFTSVNGLWSKANNPIAVAKDWQNLGSTSVVETLQKLIVDLLRFAIANKPPHCFFPVQRTWLEKTSKKLDRQQLITLNEQLNHAKKQLTSSVDELLILEPIAYHFYKLT